MKSGAAFSAIILFWIIGLLLAIYMFMPDINRSLKTIESINSSLDKETTQLGVAESESLIDYSPLSIFNK